MNSNSQTLSRRPTLQHNHARYDAESRIVAADGGSTAAYIYDAEGRRVRKTTASAGAVDYLYDLDGHQVAEVSAAGVYNRGELYLGSRHLVTYTAGPNGTTYFIHGDWLGTERARTDVNGNVCEAITSLPFGDNQNVTSTCPEGDVSPMHFTGKERDSESGLDDFDARYYSSSMGRFMSPDWSVAPMGVPYADFGNPQSLNLYSYVKNNPLNATDPDGHDDFDFLGLRSAADSFFNGFVKQSMNTTLDIATASLKNGDTTKHLALDLVPRQGPDNPSEAAGMLTVAVGTAFVPGGGEQAAAAEGSNIVANAAKGAASETNVLNELGVAKNTEAVLGTEGRSIPDFQTSKTVGEIKDVKQVSNTRQLRIQKEAAQRSGRQHELHTGVKTNVTDNAAQGTKLVRRNDLGPQ